jgi:hypothetical protein
MPRDGSNVYHRPPGTDAVTDTTIESSKYNAFVADVEQDLNTPRPIVAGGTGASDAATAIANLGGERAAQVVTNYDSQVFVAGSFYSASTATNPPVTGHSFAGICYVSDAANMVIEARDLDGTVQPGRNWVRQKKAGVWSAWAGDASLYISDTPPVGASDNSLWWESDTGLLFVRYNDGDSTQWVIALPMPDVAGFVAKAGDTMTGPLVLPGNPTTALQAAPKQYVDATAAAAASTEVATKAVRYDAAQALTDAQLVQARQNIYAAPLDALGYYGIQINGSFDVDQPALGSAVISGAYITDQWASVKVGTWTATAQRVADAPSGYSASLKVTVTAGNGAPAAGDYIGLRHYVEGLRIQRLRWGTANAQPLSIGFWVKMHRPGLYSGSVTNQTPSDRAYPFTFTVNAADTWEYKTITVPGDTTGTWSPLTNALGLNVFFMLAAGSTLSGAPNAWGAWVVAATGIVNGAQAATDTYQITGLVLLPGMEMPNALHAPLITRHVDQELQACQRYFWRTSGVFVGYPYVYGNAYTAGQPVGTSVSFGVKMRATPILAKFGTWNVSNCGQPNWGNPSPEGALLYSSSIGAGAVAAYQQDATTYLTADARL